MLQEIFLLVYKNLREVDPSLSFSSWIYRITHNYVRSHFRMTQARPQTVDLAPAIIESISSDLDIATSVDQSILKEKIRAALYAIDEKYRSVLILKFLEQKDYEEISDILKKPSGTIGTLIHRAKKKLKEELQQENLV